MSRRVRVLAPGRFPVASRNSDVSYLLGLKVPGYSLTPTSGLLSTLEFNAKYLAPPVARRLRSERMADALSRRHSLTRIHMRGAEFTDVVGAIGNIYLPRRWPDVPVIFEHDFLTCGVPPWSDARAAYLGRLDLTTISKAAAIVVRSEASAAAARDLMPGYPEHRVRVIPHLMPHIRSGTRRPLEFFTQPEELRVLFVGNQARRKGLEVLAKAVSVAQQRGANVRLLAFSNFTDGPIHGLPNSTEVRTGQDRNQVRKAMEESHILVLPSFNEAFGMVLAEGAAAGCALIYPAFEPQLSLFVGTGWPSPPGDVDALAQTLSTWSDDRESVYLSGAAAQRRWHQLFHPDRVARLYAKLFEDTFV